MNRSRIVSITHDVEHHSSTQPNASHARVRVPSRARVREHSHTHACALRTSARSRVLPSVRRSVRRRVSFRKGFSFQKITQTTSHEPSLRDYFQKAKPFRTQLRDCLTRRPTRHVIARTRHAIAARDASGFLHFIRRNAWGSGASTRAWAVDKVDSSCSCSCEKC